MGLIGAFRVITLLVGAEGSHIDPEKIIAGPNRTVTGHVNIHMQRPKKPLRVKFAVTDQLSAEHRMPTIMIQTIDMTPEK